MYSWRTKSALADGVGRMCWRRAWHHRCPQCGRGELFSSWAHLRERCPVCGLVYRREPGAELGSMMISTLVHSALATALFFAVVWWTNLSPWAGLALCGPVMVGTSYGLLPTSMAVWVAIDYMTDVASGEWWARPRR